jgi:hypothetical protein
LGGHTSVPEQGIRDDRPAAAVGPRTADLVVQLRLASGGTSVLVLHVECTSGVNGGAEAAELRARCR